jgi:hypothetical protein
MSEVELIEVEPGKWRVKREPLRPARSDLPLPNVISDIMPPTEQVDGRFYTSKAEFRRVGRSLGLTEIGTEKLAPKRKSTDSKSVARERRQALQIAIEKYKAGHRPRTKSPNTD